MPSARPTVRDRPPTGPAAGEHPTRTRLWLARYCYQRVTSRVSKKRPSSRRPVKPRAVVDRSSESYWRQRVYRNTYTHQGRRFEVGRWSVKIQIAGVRRTFSLESADQPAAAHEALLLYRRLSSGHGARPAAGPLHDSGSGGEPGQLAAAAASVERSQPAYWKPRLIRRKYVGRDIGRSEGEWSVLIEHKSERGYFPLGTTDEGAAAAAAAERYQVIVTHGWKQARLSFFREITVGVVWSANPFACTYTTLLAIPATEPGESPAPANTPARQQVILILEPDYGIRRALTQWLGRQQSVATRVLATDPADAVATIRANPGALTLVNVGAAAPASGEHLLHALAHACPNDAIFGYGVFDDSDHIFASLSGVTGGYLLRRRPPGQLLEPVLGVGARSRAEPPATAQTARRYFERLFDFADNREAQPDAGLLTSREYEILSCLSKGFQDKEIADRLSISVWTVHSHLRKIFVKYGVHSRTEAVVKYLRL